MVNGELKLKTFTLKLLDKKDGGVWCNMALPTIDKTGYRPEPLVLDKFINLLDLKIVNEFYPAIDLQKYIQRIEHNETVLDYLKYIKVTVMCKK